MNRSKPNGTPVILPEPAPAFLASLECTVKPNTAKHYRSSLRSFYRFLLSRKLDLRTVKRSHLEEWYKQLYSRGLSASARCAQISSVRRYLEWLWDQEQLALNPRLLFRREDFPKLPQYLPRPLPPLVDIELTQRLELSDSRYAWGLLLLRYTGMRIGEMRSLPWDCLRSDERDIVFIKVPLGKLDNERLVPLESKAHALVCKLQCLAPLPRSLLIEYPEGGKITYNHMREALREIVSGIKTTEPITSHRFRHTYATTLLNAGASLETVMKLLGHRDIHMTLRYADVTQHTITKEFFAAVEQIQKNLSLPRSGPATYCFDPISALDDLAHWLTGSQTINMSKRIACLKRLARFKNHFEKILAG
jgi:site-specific recombinase XerD